MTGLAVTLLVFVGVPLLFGARTRISRLEYRLRLVEEELRRRIASGQEVLHEEPELGKAAVRPWVNEELGGEAPAAPTPVAPEAEPEPQAEPEPEATIAQPFASPLPSQTSEAIGKAEPVQPENVENHAAASAQDPRETGNVTDTRLPHRASINFEELFGRKLPIWAGGITLAIAGVLIVKYAMDIGFFARVFTPGVQAVCGMLFGLGLIGGAEWAWRKQDKVQDPRVAQALSGAGVSTLYAALLVAANVYDLIEPLVAFAGLALVTAGALWLSLRHGVPSALLGLAGGLAAPALTVGLDANVPMLSTYLAFTIAGLVGISRIQRWPWLALMALAGGAGWSLWLVIAGQALSALGALSLGAFVLLLAITLPLFAFRGAAANLLRAISAIVGAVQLALLVATGGYQPLHWGLFVLIAAAGQWLAWRDRDFSIVPTLSAALAVLLVLFWPDPDAFWLATIGLALVALHALPLLARLWSKPVRLQWAVELSAIAAAVPLIVLRHFHAPWGAPDLTGSLAAVVGALLALTGAGLGWNVKGREADQRLVLLLAAGSALLAAAVWLGLSHWQAPLWTGAIAAALLLLAPPSGDPRVEPLAAGFSMLALLTLAATLLPDRLAEVAVLFGIDAPVTDATSLLRWGGLSAILALFAWRAESGKIRLASASTATALIYGAIAQLVPAWTLPMLMSALGAALLLLLRGREAETSETLVLPFAGASVLLLAITGTHPLGEWLRLAGTGSSPADVLSALRWLAPAALGLLLALRARQPALRAAGQAMGAMLAYGAAAQVAPAMALPLIPAASILGLALANRRLPWPTTRAVVATLAVLSAAWALVPLAQWISDATVSLAGIPMLLDSPDLAAIQVLRRLLGPALLLAGALWLLRGSLGASGLTLAGAATGAVSVIALHCLYRAGFAAAFGPDFVSVGLSQRLIWDTLLMGAAVVLWKRGSGLAANRAAPALTAIAAWHVAWYSLLLHNPLWSVQHVGDLPLANMLLPLFAMLPLGLHLVIRMRADWADAIDRLRQPVLMTMVALFGWATLRHGFHGTLLVEPGVTPLEDILRSLLGIALAVGYLLWGIRVGRHNWRIASLVLMLAAVGKVFLFDASGLEGLLRIASFVALGFSLIGIGWLYSRQLQFEEH